MDKPIHFLAVIMEHGDDDGMPPGGKDGPGVLLPDGQYIFSFAYGRGIAVYRDEQQALDHNPGAIIRRYPDSDATVNPAEKT